MKSKIEIRFDGENVTVVRPNLKSGKPGKIAVYTSEEYERIVQAGLDVGFYKLRFFRK